MVLRFVLSPEVQKGQVLNYIPKKEPMEDEISWLHLMSDKTI
jgi:hypothetical protein